ncbi:hypothetical protein HOY34_11360 [Xinfangfangia sp. D13-10-4-6]|uniref:hypothetical protein n=1 Tax=Pseudogemmobacter hezensis TaxID=2737662 RepID=UPI0015567D45|nr:hypothetical protein [Pseudogemmobacter hezensis]NPD15799.1 hypothetical protein [Pseudogemmobacter hezensis]
MIHIEPSATGISESAVTYRNVLTEGALSWSSQTPDGFAANTLGPQTYDYWTPAAMPATLAVALPDPVDCDCAAIIAHTLGSSGATVHVEGSLAGASWVTVSTVTPADDRDLFMLFSAEQPYSRWRIRITGPTAPAIGIAWIGPRLFIPDGVAAGYKPLNMALDIELKPSVTRGGQYLGVSVKKKGGGTSIPLVPQRRWWIQSDAAPFIEHYNHGRPFLWISCPDLHPDDAHYCWRAGDTLSASFGAGSVYGDMSMEVSAYVGS